MTQVDVQASSLPAGPPLFATIYDIRTIPTATSFTVTFWTDQAVQAAINWVDDTTAPSIGGGPLTGIVNDAAATTQHSIAVTPTQSAAGKTYAFYIQLATTDVTGLILRPRDGFVQLTGARAAANQTLPVRFNMYGDGTRPPNGGGTGSPPAGPASGNWSSYTWAQYNPKRTTFPTP